MRYYGCGFWCYWGDRVSQHLILTLWLFPVFLLPLLQCSLNVVVCMPWLCQHMMCRCLSRVFGFDNLEAFWLLLLMWSNPSTFQSVPLLFCWMWHSLSPSGAMSACDCWQATPQGLPELLFLPGHFLCSTNLNCDSLHCESLFRTGSCDSFSGTQQAG